jgi:hypothetical protein
VSKQVQEDGVAKWVNARVSDDLWEAVNQWAAEQDLKVSQVVRKALRAYPPIAGELSRQKSRIAVVPAEPPVQPSIEAIEEERTDPPDNHYRNGEPAWWFW